MGNFISNQISKFATLAIIFGLLLTCVGLWQTFKERNVGSEPQILESADLNGMGDELLYATVSGGTIDLLNTYEYTVTRKRRSTALIQEYFVPVTDASGSVQYILQTETEPGSLNASGNTHTGLLQSSSTIPGDLADTYKSKFPGQSYPVLDASYKPKTMIQSLKNTGLFFGLAVAGFVVRLLTRSK